MNHFSYKSLAIAGAVLIAALLVGGEIGMYLNPAGLILVLGGTLAGAMLAFPLNTLKDLWAQLKGLPRARVLPMDQLVEVMVRLARLQRTDGVRELEAEANRHQKRFLQLGVALVADNLHPRQIRERLEQELDMFLSRREAQRAVLGLMGRLAPAFGLAGTMIGLIRMLHTINDPSAITDGMSVALLSTFYGLMLANLVVLPFERKLSELTRAEAEEATLITEGVLGLAEGLNGAAIEAHLRSFVVAREQGGAPLTLPGSAALLKGFKDLSKFSRRRLGHGR